MNKPTKLAMATSQGDRRRTPNGRRGSISPPSIGWSPITAGTT